MRARSSGVTATLGASSIIFWCRRCTEHSRSPEVEHGAVQVAEHLDLDVARALDVLLDVDGVVAEAVPGLALRGAERGGHLAGRAHDAHPLPAPTGRRLEQHGVAEPLGDAQRLVGVAQRLGGARTTGVPARMASCRAAVLLPIASIASAGGPTHASPASRTARANHSRSLRKP
jgi:hypothetical protein